MLYFHLLTSLVVAIAFAQSTVGNSRASCPMVPKRQTSNLICGSTGTLDENKISLLYIKGNVADAATCADSCRETYKCMSFGHYADQSCHFYAKGLKSMGFSSQTNTNSTIFYNKGCWRQDCSNVVGKYRYLSSFYYQNQD
jgi:hypothetical protein